MQRLISSILVCSLLIPFSLPAQEESKPTVNYNIQDVALMAIENNQQLEVERYSPQIQTQAVREAWAGFDPVLQGGLTYEEQERRLDQRSFNATQSLFGGGEDGEDSTVYGERNAVYQAGVQGLVPFGTQYSLSMRNNEIKNDSNNFDSEFSSELTLNLTQPLLRGFGSDYNLAVVRIQESRLEQERFRLHSTVTQVLQKTLSTCAELIFAQENLKVKAEAIELAKELYENNKRRVEQGQMSEVDVMQAENRISEAEEEQLEAETFYISRLNELRALIYEDSNEYHDVPIHIRGELNLRENLPQRNSLLISAKMHNPQYRAALEQLEEGHLSFERAQNEKRPEVNLVGSVGYQGLDFDDTWAAAEDYQNRDDPNFSVGVSVELPLWNEAAKSAERAALLTKRQSRHQVAQVRNTLVSRLDQALGTVKLARRRIDTAARSVKLAESALQAEEKRLENGRTTSFNVAEMQRNLSMTRTRELSAKVELETALISLWAVVGRLDEQLNLRLDSRDKWNQRPDKPFKSIPRPFTSSRE